MIELGWKSTLPANAAGRMAVEVDAGLGELPRTEATGLLLVALALIWLKPTVSESVVPSGGGKA